MSLTSARKIAEALGNEQPVAFYVRSQAKAIEARGGKGSALRSVAAVTEELNRLTTKDLRGEGEDLVAAIDKLQTIATEAMSCVVPEESGAATKRHDVHGRVAAEPAGVERDPFGRRV